MFNSITFEQLLALPPRSKVGLSFSMLVTLALVLWILDSPHTLVDLRRSLRNHLAVSVPSIFIIVTSSLFAFFEFARNCFDRYRFNE